MGKKCIPGVICIENMTLFVLLVILCVLVYMFYRPMSHLVPYEGEVRGTYGSLMQMPLMQRPMQIQRPMQMQTSQMDVLNDPYTPPTRIETRGTTMQYSQIGILTKDGVILPLMGRQYMSGRDKWQYYTISNTGNLNTKLPVSVKGKSCTSEYGCDQIMNGDQVYVEGYNNTFDATVYENNMFSYNI